MSLHQKIWIFLVFGIQGLLWSAPSVTLLLSQQENLPIQRTGSNVLVGRFLIVNPDLIRFTIYITLGNGCHLQHFSINQSLPLQQVKLRSIGDADYILYDRPPLGTDCGILEWTVPVSAPYLGVYPFDLLASWNSPGTRVSLAGIYQELIQITVLPTP